MNKQTLKTISAFLLGAVAGAAGTYKVLYGYFEKRENEEVAKLNDQYLDTLKELKQERDQLKYAPPKQVEILTDEQAAGVHVTKKTKRSKKAAEEPAKPVEEETPAPFKEDYTQYTKTVVEHPEEENKDVTNDPKGPTIIPLQVYLDDNKYEHMEWTWLANGELMIDEDDEIVNHPEDYIDKVIDEVGTDFDDSVVCVRNDVYGWMIHITINTSDDYDSFIGSVTG